MTFPHSSDVPCLPKAAESSNGASAGRSVSFQLFSINGVKMAPGATALTRTSRWPFSLAAALVKPMIPCLLASYAPCFAKPTQYVGQHSCTAIMLDRL